ncbi:hypothetical protein [Mycobacterium sp. URHB0021]
MADIDAAAGASTNAAGAGATVVADLAAATVIRSITSGAAVAARIGAAFVAEIGAAVVADIRAAASAPSANVFGQGDAGRGKAVDVSGGAAQTAVTVGGAGVGRRPTATSVAKTEDQHSRVQANKHKLPDEELG